MKKVALEIDGKKVEVQEGTKLLEAAQKLNLEIPTLCSHKALTAYGSCRLCLVEVTTPAGSFSLQSSCTYPALEGLVVRTNTERVLKTRKMMAELLLSRCPESAEVKKIAQQLGVNTARISYKNKDCILCGLCVRMCQERMGRGAINFIGRGRNKEVSSPFGQVNEVCQACGACDFICPTNKIIMANVSKTKAWPIPFEFNEGLLTRPAVYIPYPQAVPNLAIIDDKTCVQFLTGECRICKEICEAEAINYADKEKEVRLNAGAVIITPGVKLFDAHQKKEYGYGRYANVISSIQFERILSSSGPTKGEVLRPADGRPPQKIAFLQCVGSRDPSVGNEFCSSVCCMYSIKEAVIAKEHDANIAPTIFFMDIRSFGRDFERYYEEAKDLGVRFKRCIISKVYEQYRSKNLRVKYLDEDGKIKEEEFDLVVLALGLTDTCTLKPWAEKLGIKTNPEGFIALAPHSPGETSRQGIFAAGTYLEPKDIPESVAEGSAASSLAARLLKEKRGSLAVKKEYPSQRDTALEELRIGVFVCRCGRNIASVVNVPEVVEHAKSIKDVVYAREFLYSCSQDALENIKEDIRKHSLNRVVVASCTPRTHDELFRDTVREAGLNKYLFEMASIREQVSWVHKDKPAEATQKAKELVNMMVAKARLFKPLETQFSEVHKACLIVGGGAAGMQAALFLAEQDFKVYLVEKEKELGGNFAHLFYNPDNPGIDKFFSALKEKILADKNITVMLEAVVKETSGFVGNFKSLIQSREGKKEVEHGAVIIATGAKEYEIKPSEYGWGASPNIITQVNLEEVLAKDNKSFKEAQTLVMIQCVGSRNDEHPYCSRVCCTHAVKNALKLKEINPEHKIIVLYRDMRTYGFWEKYYLKAREQGVVFSRFEKGKEPVVTVKNNKITLRSYDELLKENIDLNPDWLILSAGMAPLNNEEIAKTFKVSLSRDKFFLEAHPKIRPLDFTTEGVFFCGLAHSPRFLQESLMQAQGAAMRALTVLSKDKIETKAITACVNERLCKGCGMCVAVCPYSAREIDAETRVAKVVEVLCQGCGACAAVCPSHATTHKGFTKQQILSMLDEATTKGK